MSLRRLILHFMPPNMRAHVEAESRKWVATCPNCQAVNSIWDIGGLRYLAIGSPIRLASCPKCGKVGPHRFEKRG